MHAYHVVAVKRTSSSTKSLLLKMSPKGHTKEYVISPRVPQFIKEMVELLCKPD